MSLIVETGAGLPDADSYISVWDADTYFAARGNATWAALAEEGKEQALRRATDYMGQAYGGSWKGVRVSMSQALDWPRDGVFLDGQRQPIPDDIVPIAVQRACAELAVRDVAAGADGLAPDLGPQVFNETVGPISITYQNGGRQTPKYQAVDRLLSPYVMGGGSQIRVVRA